LIVGCAFEVYLYDSANSNWQLEYLCFRRPVFRIVNYYRASYTWNRISRTNPLSFGVFHAIYCVFDFNYVGKYCTIQRMRSYGFCIDFKPPLPCNGNNGSLGLFIHGNSLQQTQVDQSACFYSIMRMQARQEKACRHDPSAKESCFFIQSRQNQMISYDKKQKFSFWF